MIAPQVLLDITDYAQQTWSVKQADMDTLVSGINLIIESCISEKICAVDYQNAEDLEVLRAGLNNMVKGLNKIESQFSLGLSDMNFLGDETLLASSKRRTHLLTGHEEIKDVHEDLTNAVTTLTKWLERQQSMPKPTKFIYRNLIIRELLPLYYGLTGLSYKSCYGSDRTERTHDQFSRVAILIDALYGNPSSELVDAHKQKDKNIKITNIVDCDPETINKFCQYIYDNFFSGKNP